MPAMLNNQPVACVEYATGRIDYTSWCDAYCGEYYPMSLIGDDKTFVLVAVEEGIDSRLEGFTKSHFILDCNRLYCAIYLDEMSILLRRLSDMYELCMDYDGPGSLIDGIILTAYGITLEDYGQAKFWFPGEYSETSSPETKYNDDDNIYDLSLYSFSDLIRDYTDTLDLFEKYPDMDDPEFRHLFLRAIQLKASIILAFTQ